MGHGTEPAPDAELIVACRDGLERNLGLRPGERLLVVTDAPKVAIGRAFAAAARRITPLVELLEIPVAERNGQEPPAEAARRIVAADVVLAPTSCSLSWTRARREATAAGVRFASMPRITREIVLRTFGIDYEPVRERVNRICDVLDAGRQVHVTTEAGTGNS